MTTDNLDSAVKREEHLSVKVEDDDGGTFDDDYSTNYLAGLATISNRISQVRDKVYQRCGKLKKGHGSQCSMPYTPPSRPDFEADLFAVGEMATIRFAPVVAECMGSQYCTFPCAHKHCHIASQPHA